MPLASPTKRTRARSTPPPDVFDPKCPSRELLDHLTSRWGVLILVTLREGTFRFGELRRRVGGVSEKMLSQTLGTLEEDGFVSRTVFAEIPPRVEYALTPLGKEAAEQLATFLVWIESSVPRVRRARELAAAKR